jgi:LacI family gluconate utilization system Gnt-I transcriptional repressor
MEFMASTVPPLSSVRTNRYEMGRNAVAMVTAAIEGTRPAEPIVDLGFELMIRPSSAAPAHDNRAPRLPIRSA